MGYVSGDLPQPHGWNNRYALFGSMLVIAVAGSVYFAVKTALAAAHGHWAAAVVVVSAAVVFVVPAVWIALMLTGRGRLRASVDGAGTTLTLGPAARWLSVWFIAVIVSTVSYLALGASLHGELPDVRVRSIAFLSVMVVVSVVGLGLVIRGSRRDRPAVRLSMAGVEFHDAVTRFALRWEEITEITGVVPEGNRFRPIVFWHHGVEPAVIGNAGLYVPGGVGLFWLVRFYWHQPIARAELCNGVAIERLRAGSVPVS